jgi:hypothetical protein
MQAPQKERAAGCPAAPSIRPACEAQAGRAYFVVELPIMLPPDMLPPDMLPPDMLPPVVPPDMLPEVLVLDDIVSLLIGAIGSVMLVVVVVVLVVDELFAALLPPQDATARAAPAIIEIFRT